MKISIKNFMIKNFASINFVLLLEILAEIAQKKFLSKMKNKTAIIVS